MNDELFSLLERNLEHAETFDDEDFDHVQEGQSPEFVTVSCCDSRVLQDEMIGNSVPGKVFTVGNIGNRVMEHTEDGRVTAGDVLYPIVHTGTKNVLVVGHTSCGAVTATYKDITEGIEEPAGIRHCIEVLKERLQQGVERLPDDLDEDEAIDRLVEYNVDQQVAFLRESGDVPEDVNIIGLVYDFQDVYSEDRGRLHIINIDGKRDPETLEAEHPEIAGHVERLWEY